MNDYTLKINYENYDEEDEKYNTLTVQIFDNITMSIYENYRPRQIWAPVEVALDLTLREILEKHFIVKKEEKS